MIMSSCGENISSADLLALESLIGGKLSPGFKDFYLSWNGGVSERDYWDSQDEYEPVRVKLFKSIAGCNNPCQAETKFIEGCYAAMTARNVIPSGILPFALDDGGNFFCVEVETGRICFFATDAFDPDATMLTNQMNAIRYLAPSFVDFVAGLVEEEELE